METACMAMLSRVTLGRSKQGLSKSIERAIPTAGGQDHQPHRAQPKPSG